MIRPLAIENPKRGSKDSVGRASWYSYYAGFSCNFAYSLLASAGLSQNSRILDPWNGGGTTTTSASSLGLSAQGYDLNPAMVIIAKARLLGSGNESSLMPIAAEIFSRTLRDQCSATDGHDPQNDSLGMWFQAEGVVAIRQLERSICRLLVDESGSKDLREPLHINKISHLASFYYVALFRSVRFFLRPFFASNPTWIKKAKHEEEKIRPGLRQIVDRFEHEIRHMYSSMEREPTGQPIPRQTGRVEVACSQDLPDPDCSVDFVLSSPPYCTRIDYAVATLPELAILGYSYHTDFRHLRRNLIGTATVPASAPALLPAWGATCNEFLQSVQAHDSKASGTYYYKNHLQYFDSVHKSLAGISRVLVPKGRCVLVVQDSYYKDVHNDLPQVFVEMGRSLGLLLARRQDFPSERSMARINSRRRKYQSEKTIESVLFFMKDETGDK